MAARAAAAAAALEFTSRYSTRVLFTRGREGRDGWLLREASNLIVAFCLIPIIPDYKYLSFPIDAIIKKLYLSLRKYQISDKLCL